MNIFLDNLFRNMPQLHEVTLDVEGGGGPTGALTALNNSECSSNLTSLQVAGSVDLGSLTAILSLAQKANNLKVLKFFYWEKVHRQECRQALIDIVKCCQSNLDELQIFGLDCKEDMRWFFRKELLTGVKSIRIVPQSKIVFRRFAVEGIDPIQYANTFNVLDIETKPETKISAWKYSAVDESLLECLADCYPEAVNLEVEISAGVLILWSWRQLRVLNISIELPKADEQKINLYMLGITEQELERLQKLLDRKIVTNVQIQRWRSSIVDLRDLKSLTIKYEYGNCSLDLTGYFGLAKMSWLETLTLSLGKDCLSIDCKDYIRKNLSKSTVNITER